MILNLFSKTSVIDVPFINFEPQKQYYLRINTLGAQFTKTRTPVFINIDCNAIDACYGLPYTIIMDGVCVGRECLTFISQRSDLRFRINTYNWRNTKFEIHFSDPNIKITNFWTQVQITSE